MLGIEFCLSGHMAELPALDMSSAFGFFGVFDAFDWRNPRIRVPARTRRWLLLTVRCDLVNAKPLIWRRLELRSELTLDLLHPVIQGAMGWEAYHLYQFSEPNATQSWGPHFLAFDDDENAGTPEEDVQVNQVLRQVGDTIRYEYDFGDGWSHRLKVEKIESAPPSAPWARCIGGRKACPSEDCGGIWTWNDLAQSLRVDPSFGLMRGSDDHCDYADWLPDDLDPDHFDSAEANARIADVMEAFEVEWE